MSRSISPGRRAPLPGAAALLPAAPFAAKVAARARRRHAGDAVAEAEALARERPVWNSTSGLGGPHQTSELSSSIKSKSIRLIFGRIDCSRRALEAHLKSLRRNCRICAHWSRVEDLNSTQRATPGASRRRRTRATGRRAARRARASAATPRTRPQARPSPCRCARRRRGSSRRLPRSRSKAPERRRGTPAVAVAVLPAHADRGPAARGLAGRRRRLGRPRRPHVGAAGAGAQQLRGLPGAVRSARALAHVARDVGAVAAGARARRDGEERDDRVLT